MTSKRAFAGLMFSIAAVTLAADARARQDSDQPAKKDEAPKKVQTVDFRKLKELMPAELAGIKRTNVEGQKVAAGGFSMSTASATYEKKPAENADADKDADNAAPQVRVEVMDYGDKQAAEGLAAWASTEIDQESDTGYTRTVKIGAHPAMETWDKDSKTGTLQVYVGKRFILTVTTNNLPSEQLQKIGKALPLDKLAALK